MQYVNISSEYWVYYDYEKNIVYNIIIKYLCAKQDAKVLYISYPVFKICTNDNIMC